jgi:hypothetical protein
LLQLLACLVSLTLPPDLLGSPSDQL